jgi:hypothetical protein
VEAASVQLELTGRLLFGTLRAIGDSIGAFLGLALPWYALWLLLHLVAGPDAGAAGFETELPGPSGSESGTGPWWLLTVACALASGTMIGVAWHRHLLLREGVALLRLPVRRHLRYLLRFLQLAFLAFLAVFAAGYVGVRLGGEGDARFLIFFALALLVILPLALRLAVMLPAAALDEPVSLRGALSLTSGLGLPLVLVALVFFLLLAMAAFGAVVVVHIMVSEGVARDRLSLQAALACAHAGGLLLFGALLSGAYFISRDRAMQLAQGSTP